MTIRQTCPPVASPEAAAYDSADHADCRPDDVEPAEWETDPVLLAELDADPVLLAELDAEMQQQAEEWERVTGPWVPVAGGMDDKPPY